jgi:hypothetical protein
MEPIKPIPELEQAIEAHARAVLSDDRDAAEKFVAERGLESHRAAMAALAGLRPLDSSAVLARARIGFQYIGKVRFAGARGKAVWQGRWANQGGWKIVEVEDLSGKRSAWSDIPPRTARAEQGNGHA